MKKYFYSEIIEVDSLLVALDDLNISEKEKEHLLSLAHENIHYIILDTIMDKLSEADKKTFLSHVHTQDHAQTILFLKEKINDIEEILKLISKDAITKLHNDIEELKKTT